jgi:hypothetical protein
VPDRFVCAQCGAPGVVEPGFTQIDARYAKGRCTGTHEGIQYLVREGVDITDRKKKARPTR